MAIKRNCEIRSNHWHLALAGGIAVVALLLLGSVDIATAAAQRSGDDLATARIVSSELDAEWQAQAEESPMEVLELSIAR